MATTHKATDSAVRRGILFLCLLAMALSAWLTYQKLTGRIDSLAGCGKGSDCAAILGSRWSVVFRSIPVSLPSFFLYLALFVSLVRRTADARTFLLIAAWTLLAAAGWFIGIQVFMFSGFCAYCMATHGIGMLTALGLFWMSGRGHGRECRYALPVGIGAVGVLALLQVFGPLPDSHRVDRVAGGGGGADVHAVGEGRLVTFFGGKKSFRVNSLPHLGNPDASHVLVKYFDYRCDACRKMDGYLDTALNRYPEEVAVIVLPSPLNRSCNRHMPVVVDDYENACELAQYALGVWRVDPDQFTGYHRWLFKNHTVSLDEAKAEAIRRVAEPGFQEALTDEWVGEVIRQNCEDYSILAQRTPVMPKLLLGGNKVLQGASISAGRFMSSLKESIPLGE